MAHTQAVFDPELRADIRRSGGVVIPVGSSEQHGAHLPVSTDADIAGEVARRLCGKVGLTLMPAIPYGVSFEHAPLYNASLRPSTLVLLLTDLIHSLASNGAKTVFVINGHHGNQKALQRLERRTFKGVRVFVWSYWHFMKQEMDHAGLAETSMMLAISDCVRMSRAKKGFVESDTSMASRARLAKKASESFTLVAKNGIWGDPRRASPQKGRALLSEIVRNMEKKCQTCLTE